MSELRILLDGDGCWPDLADKVGTPAVCHVTEGVEVALLRGGMMSGSSSVTVRAPLADGRVVLMEVSLRQLEMAVQAFRVAERGRTPPPKRTS